MLSNTHYGLGPSVEATDWDFLSKIPIALSPLVAIFVLPDFGFFFTVPVSLNFFTNLLTQDWVIGGRLGYV